MFRSRLACQRGYTTAHALSSHESHEEADSSGTTHLFLDSPEQASFVGYEFSALIMARDY